MNGVIALDFDETYNTMPDMYDEIINVFQGYGFKVILATYRHPTSDYDPLFERLEDQGVPVYCTDGKAKKKYMEDLGIKVDIWIDDNPRSILEDSAWKHDSPELHAWREEQRQKLIDMDLRYEKNLRLA